jgi:hypothetical protein
VARLRGCEQWAAGTWARAFDRPSDNEGGRSPRMGSGSVLGASAWQAMAELVTVRLAELVSARLSDGCRVPLQSVDEVHDRNWGREEGKA